MKVKVIVDSTFNLEKAFVEENEIEVIPLNVIIDGATYQDGVDISFNEVLDAAFSGKNVTSSQPSPALFQEYFERLRDEGATDIICMTMSSTLSGTYQAANLAKSEVTGVNIHIIDTLSTAIGAEIQAEILVEDLKSGMPMMKAIDKINRIKQTAGILINMENLTALRKSGRIHRIKATIGNLLRVKPIIEYFNGTVTINSKCRTERHVVEWCIDKMKAALSGITSRIHIYVAYVNSPARVTNLVKKIKEIFPNVIFKLRDGITPVIAVNIGYGGFGIAWCYE